MIQIKLSNGFTGEVDETSFDDMRFVDLLAGSIDPDISDGLKMVAFSKLIGYIVGDQKKKLYDCIAKEHGGKVPVAAMQSVLGEIMTQVRELPKSSPSPT